MKRRIISLLLAALLLSGFLPGSPPAHVNAADTTAPAAIEEETPAPEAETPKVDERLEKLTSEPRSAVSEAEAAAPAEEKADLSQANAKLNDLLGGK